MVTRGCVNGGVRLRWGRAGQSEVAMERQIPGNNVARRGGSRQALFTVVALIVLGSLTGSVSAAPKTAGDLTAAAKRVFADFGCDGPKRRPHLIVFTCADAGLLVRKIHYSSWGGRIARGRGTVRENTCDPACVYGNFRDYPARLRMSRIRYCANTGHDQYRRLVVHSRAFKNRRHLLVATPGCHTWGAP
jgi:hypothetical protein